VNTQYAGIGTVPHYFKIPNLIADSDLHTRKKMAQSGTCKRTVAGIPLPNGV
jgi:hypothetical protein